MGLDLIMYLYVHLCLQKRHVLEQTEQLEPRVSALDEDLEGDDEDEEEEDEEEEEEEDVRIVF